MNTTFCLLPMSLSRRIEIGRSAGGGIARQYSMCGIARLRVHRDSPSGTPSATPTTTAIPNPRPIRSRLGTTCDVNCEKSQSSWNSMRMVVSLGNLNALGMDCPHLPRDEDRHRHRNLGRESE